MTKTFNGKPCIWCDATLRYKSDKSCVACAKKRAKEWRLRQDPTALAERAKKFREKNPEYVEKARKQMRERNNWRYNNDPEFKERSIAGSRDWQKNNPEKTAENTRKWRKNNPEKVREQRRKHYLKKKLKND